MDLELDQQKGLVRITEGELKLVRDNFQDGVAKIVDFGANRVLLQTEIAHLKHNIAGLDEKINDLNILIESLRDSSSRWEATSVDLELKLAELRKMLNAKRLEHDGLKTSTSQRIEHLETKLATNDQILEKQILQVDELETRNAQLLEVQVENRKTIADLGNKINFLQSDLNVKIEEYKTVYEKRKVLVTLNNDLKLELKNLKR